VGTTNRGIRSGTRGHRGDGGVIHIEVLQLDLPLAEIYAGIKTG
jgi:hypothetical protein